MVRFTVQLFGVTVFALGLIWFVGSGEAQQSDPKEPVLWADTFHINLEETPDSAALESRRQDRDSFLMDVKKLTHTALNIRNQYMEEVNTEEIIKAGINGMLSDLDRFSVLMEKSSYDALMESTHGKYEGLGMQIDERNDRIVIISPIEGTPAYNKGLRAGDIIWAIDGKSTEGMTSAEASKMMRGKAGTSIKLAIKRNGIEEPIEFELERALIELKSVNYAGVIPGTTIGYVRLSRFAEETSHELRQAISDLNGKGITALVFDLRSNGGGLLDQAKETAELFLQEGREIVYTKGRFENTERHYRAERPPLFPPDKPLVILVDEGTASASEIVAGAVQDWDRGLIVGNTTYGKGLVQQIFPISSDGSMALKLTTAKYYVPSGRCIQKPETQAKPGSHAALEDEETEAAPEKPADSLAVSSEEIYYTNGGRVVYGGGGIVPDIEIARETWKPIEINLYQSGLFFNYAVQYVADHPSVKPDVEVTDGMLDDFRQYIKKEKFDYTSSLEASLEKLRETAEREKKVDLLAEVLDSLNTLVELEKSHDFDESKDYIRRTIKREIVSAIAGQTGVYEEIVLRTDDAVRKAVEILQSGQYTKLITEGQKKAQAD
ncbi:MAG TPA: S41 family peptidase [candidate division Zixibacteria bacterium]|nr:S41 family peptidase [candidate division Zixibacteria bacterium]MDD4916881.1 S41 family peptidase [candidate division Zixibacteria bacterium]HOD67140.1 S41 family peptidase [candidate division Zixibacteria bacterium]HPM36412.1 S41 family peptidase [candidate division Zixibacteria bacterium]